MNNLNAVRCLCNAIASAFTPDEKTIEFALSNEGVDPLETMKEKDVAIFHVARNLVTGFVESSRSEGGIAISVRDEDGIKNSLVVWCKYYGLSVEEELGEQLRVVSDGSNLW